MATTKKTAKKSTPRKRNNTAKKKGTTITDHPKSTEGAADELRTRGYAATIDKLKKLVRNGTLEAVGQYGREPAWTPERINAAADHFEAKRDFMPEAAFCESWELTYGEWWRQLHRAYRRTVREYGAIAKKEIGYQPDPIHFELHATQARHEGESASIRFTLRDDVRKRIAKRIKHDG